MPRLINTYDDYLPPRFPRAKSRRAKEKIINKTKMPVVRVAGSTMNDAELCDQYLVDNFSLFQDPPRRAKRRTLRNGRGRIVPSAPSRPPEASSHPRLVRPNAADPREAPD
jgi:hypothetical protein